MWEAVWGAPDRYSEALDGNGGVKENGRTWEGEACDSEERRAAVRSVARTGGKEIQTERSDSTRKRAGQHAGDETRRSERLSSSHRRGQITDMNYRRGGRAEEKTYPRKGEHA